MQSCCCFLRHAWLQSISILQSVDEELKCVIQPFFTLSWRLSQGKPELLQGEGASFATSFEYNLEQSHLYLCPLWGREANPSPSLKPWLTFCREHEKLLWAMNSGLLVLQSWSGFMEIMTFPTILWAKGGEEASGTWGELWLIPCPKTLTVQQLWHFQWSLCWPQFIPSNMLHAFHSVFS